MNFFNRILIVLLILAIMTISFLLFLQTLQFSVLENIGMSLSLIDWLLLRSESDLRTRLIVGGSCLSVFFIGAVLLFFELKPFLSKEPRFLIVKDDLGKVEISEDSINRFINYESKSFDGVLDASSQITNKKDGLHIKSEITVQPDINIVEVTQELSGVLKNGVQKKLGLKVSNIIINTKIKEINLSKRKLN